MVKTTRRVKRSKKHVHRARGRKTNRRRYTRRQRGGTIIKVCEKSGYDLFGTSKGIAISYDDETQKYTIGNEPYDKLKTMPRYANALTLLPNPPPMNDGGSIILTQSQFDEFKTKYCTGFASLGGDQCASINDFKPPVAAAPVASAGPAPTCEFHLNGKGTRNSIILTQVPSCIAYVNHNDMYEMQSLSIKQKKYSFKNFTIELRDDSVIVGKLELDFSKGANPILFTLELKLDKGPYTPAFVSCMNAHELTSGFVTVQNVTMEKSMLKVIGNVTPQKPKDDEMYDFEGFVTNFAEKYQFCTQGIGQKLENAEQLNRYDALALVKEIDMRIGVLTKKMQENAQYAGLNQLYSELKRKNPKQIVDTPQNLETLNKINDGMKTLLSDPDMATAMGQLTFEPTGDDLAARLAAALKDD